MLTNNKWIRFKVWLILTLAEKQFPLMWTWAPKPGDTPRVVSFSTNEREFNNAVRDRVEYLDEREYNEST